MAAEHDLDQVPPSRAAQVLDRMLRPGPEADDLVEGARRPSTVRSGPGRRLAGPALAGTALVAAAAVVVVLVLLDRPPPIEEQLPLAEAASTDGARGESLAGDSSGAGAAATDDAATEDAATDDAATTGASTERQPSGGVDGGRVVVHVAGAVAAPGVVRLSNGSRVVDAVTAAGGLRADADPDRVNLAATLVDGQRVVVPVVGQPIPAEVAPAPAPSSGGPEGGASSGAVSPGTPVDLNTATAEQLDALPGVGPSTAAAILDHRASAGPFGSVDELLDVRGIGEAKLEALRDLVSVGT